MRERYVPITDPSITERKQESESGTPQEVSRVLRTEEKKLHQAAESRIGKLWHMMTSRALPKALFFGAMTFLDGCATLGAERAAGISRRDDSREIDVGEQKKRIEKFWEKIRKYKTLGYEVQASGVSQFGMNKGVGVDTFVMTRIIADLLETTEKFGGSYYEDVKDQLHFLENTYAVQEETSPALLTEKKKIKIPIFHIEGKRIGSDTFAIRLYNWFEQQPVIFEKEIHFSEKGEGDDPDRTVASLVAELKPLFVQRESDIATWQKSLDTVVPDARDDREHTFVYEEKKDEKISEESREKLLRLLDTYDITIDTTPKGGEIDRPEAALSMSKDMVKKLRHPIVVHGSIREIVLSERLDRPVTKRDNDGATVNGEPIAEIFLDTDGNVYSKVCPTYSSGNETTYRRMIFISPSLQLGSVAPQIDISLDLEALGLQSVGEWLYQDTEKPLVFLGDKGEYALYSNMDPKHIEREFAPLYDNMKYGVRAAETLFGLESGAAVRAIYIANAKQENARFHPKDPETVVIQDEILRAKNAELRAFIIAFHEAAHLLDYKYGITGILEKKRDEKIEKLFGELKNSGLFAAINEKEFSSEFLDVGGHSHENTAEFFASLLNTLNNPNWKRKFQHLRDQKVRTQYAQALHVLRERLREIPEIPEYAPVFHAITERIDFLSDNLK